MRNAEAAEVFLEKEKPDLAEIRAILADIRQDDKRASNVIDRLRSLLKRRSLELSTLDLTEVLAGAIALAQSDAGRRGVKIVLHSPAKLPVVRGDRVHLQQVLLNLILNGMDAMDQELKSERLLTVQARAAEPRGIEVAVIDRGTGMASDKQKRLFEPFFTTKPNGLGVGLAISKTIIEAHGGKIWAENHAAGGMILKFTLPAQGH